MLHLNQKGFSLIELLIVVVVIGIIVAIAVPNILSARRSANEGSAVASLRVLHSAQFMYKTTVGGGNFAGTNGGAPDAAGLNLLRDSQLVDNSIGSGFKSGYNFVGAITYPNTAWAGFYFSANPSAPSGAIRTGNKRFGIAADGVIRADAAELDLPFDAATIETALPFSF